MGNKFIYSIARLLSLPVSNIFKIFIPSKTIWFRFYNYCSLRARLKTSPPITTVIEGKVGVSGTGMVKFGEHCRIGSNVVFETADGGEIVLGNNVRINTGCVIVAHSSIMIGSDCLIGEYVSIRDANHGTIAGTLIRKQTHKITPIFIGKDVWICRGAAILKGVKIGDGAVVAANSVATDDVPANTIVGGVPARKIAERI